MAPDNDDWAWRWCSFLVGAAATVGLYLGMCWYFSDPPSSLNCVRALPTPPGLGYPSAHLLSLKDKLGR